MFLPFSVRYGLKFSFIASKRGGRAEEFSYISSVMPNITCKTTRFNLLMVYRLVFDFKRTSSSVIEVRAASDKRYSKPSRQSKAFAISAVEEVRNL